MGKSILFVDDEQGIRKVLTISLLDLGYDVHTAETGHDALELFKDVKPPIVLADIQMPGMSGIDLLRNIKKIESDTEVIMITGHGDLGLPSRASNSSPPNPQCEFFCHAGPHFHTFIIYNKILKI